MTKETFLFVPYNTQTGTRDLAVSKLTSSDARSHAAAVSRSRRDNRRAKQPDKLSPANEHDALSQSPSGTDNRQSADQDDDASTITTIEAAEHRSLDRRQHMRAMQFSWRAASSGSMKLGHVLRMNPSVDGSDSRFGKDAILYYNSVIAPLSAPIYEIFQVTNAYTEFFSVLMQHTRYRNAGIALAGALMYKATYPDSDVSNDVITFQASAIADFKHQYAQALATGQTAMDDISILTVSTLAQLSRFLGDISSYKRHRSMIREMVKQRGGLNALGHDGLSQAILRQWDMFWTYEGAKDVLFPEARTEYQAVYPVFPLDPQLREIVLGIPFGFQNIVLKGLVSIPTIHILGRITDFKPGAVQAKPPETYADFVAACPCLVEPDGSRNCLEKQMCLAVLLYCFNTFLSERSVTSLYVACRTELTRLLLNLDEKTFDFPEQETLTWACAVCMDSWRTNNADKTIPAKGHKLLPTFSRLAAATGQPRNSLRKFFFDESFDSFCHVLLDQIG